MKTHVNVCETVRLLADFFSAIAESWKMLKTSNLFSSFIVSSNRNRSAIVRKLLCNNSLFVLPELIYFLIKTFCDTVTRDLVLMAHYIGKCLKVVKTCEPRH